MTQPDLTTADVARELRIDPLTVQRYLREGRLSGYRVGRRWRVLRTALDAFKVSGAILTPGRPRARPVTTPKRPAGRPRKQAVADALGSKKTSEADTASGSPHC